jgi:L-iditol 2-dehydrogenase
MKAAVLEGVKQLVVKEVPTPVPKEDEVLIRVRSCGICGTDLKLYKGEYTGNLPIILGHELSGDVEKIGARVKAFDIGDSVVVDPNESCGKCQWCRTGNPTFCNNLAAYGVLRDGAFAEYIVVHEKGMYEIPRNLNHEYATFTEPVSCAIHCVDRANVKPGENVAIVGGGPMGQIILQLFKGAGASKTIMITRSQWKLEFAKRLGVTNTINSTNEDVPKAVNELTGGLGADIVIEAAGTPKTLEDSLTLAKRGGRIMVFGFSPEGAKATFSPFEVLSKELSILGSWVNPYTFSRAVNVLAAKQVDVMPLITNRLSIDNILIGFDLLERKSEGFMKGVVV